jgi:hypothetical protein
MMPDWSKEIRKEYRKNVSCFLADYRADLIIYCKNAYGSHVSGDGAAVATAVKAPLVCTILFFEKAKSFRHWNLTVR